MRKKQRELITYSIFHTKNTKDLCVNEENPELTRSINLQWRSIYDLSSLVVTFIYIFLQNTILRLIITIANHKNPPATLTEFSLENSFFS